MARKTGWYLDKMPEKIMALAGFHESLLLEMHTNPNIVNTITNAGTKLVAKYFEAYLDHLARADSATYHHIYEFNMTGNKNARLFKSNVRNGKLSYSFINSSVPNNNGQVFQKKAFIMEQGDPVDIYPRQAEFLVYDLNGELIFSKHSYVSNPGGTKVEGAFQSAFTSFFNSNLPEKALKELGFYTTILNEFKKQTGSISSTVRSGNVSGAKSQGKAAAQKIAREVEAIGDRL